MKDLPQIKLIDTQNQRDHFSWKYYQTSGLPVPVQYIEEHQAFQIEWKGEVIGGFIIGEGPCFRTLDTYVSGRMRPILRRVLHPTDAYSEVCCYWMDERFKNKAFFNCVTWLKIGKTIKQFAKDKILFGTSSRRLAKLYSFPLQTRLIHKDKLHGEETFVFALDKCNCLKAFWSIIVFQWKLFFRLELQNQLNKMAFAGRLKEVK